MTSERSQHSLTQHPTQIWLHVKKEVGVGGSAVLWRKGRMRALQSQELGLGVPKEPMGDQGSEGTRRGREAIQGESWDWTAVPLRSRRDGLALGCPGIPPRKQEPAGRKQAGTQPQATPGTRAWLALGGGAGSPREERLPAVKCPSILSVLAPPSHLALTTS